MCLVFFSVAPLVGLALSPVSESRGFASDVVEYLELLRCSFSAVFNELADRLTGREIARVNRLVRIQLCSGGVIWCSRLLGKCWRLF